MKYFTGHTKYILLLLPLMGLSLGSCKKYLDQNPKDRFNNATFWVSEANVQMALTGLYSGPLGGGDFDWWSSWNGLLDLEEATDNAYDRRGDNSQYNRLTNGTLTASMAILQGYWKNSYTRIARCNNFLSHIGQVPMDDLKKKQYIAEARFIRACMYHYLSQYFGGVPIVTQTLTPDAANKVEKSSEEEVVRFVENELLAAAADLPRYGDIPASEFGRANKQAALAFLGRTYMAEERWDSAAIAYEEIINFGDNGIDPDYSSLFDGTDESSNEIIFSARHLATTSKTDMLRFTYPAILAGYARFNPLGSLVEAYEFNDGTPFSYDDPRYNPKDLGENRDPRLKYTVLYNGEVFSGKPYISHPDSSAAADQIGAGKQASHTGYGLRKHLPENFAGDLSNSGVDNPLIRYAEVLLSYLESKIEAGDPITQDLLDRTINRVRGRASVDMPPITETDPAKLLGIVRHERRVELALEGIRYWDLLRWHTADSVLNGYFYGAPYPGAKKIAKAPDGSTDPNGRWYVTQKHFREQDYHWPIPQAEVNINPGLE